jgi:hypothetical protein
VIGLACLISIIVLLNSCVVHKHIHIDDFNQKYSIDEIHIILILDYLQHVNPECVDCHININDTLNHKYDRYTRLRTTIPNINEEIVYELNHYIIKDFGKITICPSSYLKCERSYRFSHFLYLEKSNTYIGEVRHPNGTYYIFQYQIIGDKYYLNVINDITYDEYR